LTLDRLQHELETAQQSIFRLQLLPVYVADTYQHFLAWQRGAAQPDEIKHTAWHDLVGRKTGEGCSMQMVHVVDRPFNDYLRYCLDWWYPNRIAAGEQVLGVDRREVDASKLPDHDFWLFDDERVIRMDYEPDGKFSAATLLNDSVAHEYTKYERYVQRFAVPFNDLAGASTTRWNR
jgi:hypothetical protein